MIKYSIRAMGKAAAGASRGSGWTGPSVGMPYIHSYVTADPTPVSRIGIPRSWQTGTPGYTLKISSCPSRYEYPTRWRLRTKYAHRPVDEHGTPGPTCEPRECRPTAKPLSAPAVCTRWRNALSRLLSFRTRQSALAATTPRW